MNRKSKENDSIVKGKVVETQRIEGKWIET